MKYCSECGNKLGDADIYCSECGTKFVDPNKVEDETFESFETYGVLYPLKKEKPKLDIGYVAHLVTIDEINFIGCFHKSLNNQYVVAYQDGNPGTAYGYRSDGLGNFLLIENDEIIVNGDMERPNDGHVADNGNFVLSDWKFSSNLIGTCCAFNKEGESLINETVNANLLNNGISSKGGYAVFQTANNEESDDGNKLFFFDLNNQKLLWKKSVKTGWAKEYQFDEDQGILFLFYDHNRCYRYNFQGEFLDEKLWQKERVKFAEGYELYDIAMEKIELLDSKKASNKAYKRLLPLLKRAVKEDVSDNTKARLYRKIGEIHYKNDDTENALLNFELALNYYPKVGVKRLYDKLKKENGSESN